jgi:hypothetical protein
LTFKSRCRSHGAGSHHATLSEEFLGAVKRLLICFTAIEGPIGQDIENLLELTGVQEDVLDPIFGLIGPLGGLFNS